MLHYRAPWQVYDIKPEHDNVIMLCTLYLAIVYYLNSHLQCFSFKGEKLCLLRGNKNVQYANMPYSYLPCTIAIEYVWYECMKHKYCCSIVNKAPTGVFFPNPFRTLEVNNSVVCEMVYSPVNHKNNEAE